MEKPVYLPFYMTYPVRYPYNQENRAARDIEYLREMYPMEAKRLLGRISEILDRMDYEESIIYDEYPDRWQLYRLAESIVMVLRNEAEQNGEEVTPEKWEWISDMVQVLLFDEIFNRRHGRQSGRRRNQIFIDREGWQMPYGNIQPPQGNIPPRGNIQPPQRGMQQPWNEMQGPQINMQQPEEEM